MNNTSTLNWDTVFAVPITSVNKAIIDMKSSPSSFSYSSEKSSISGNYRVKIMPNTQNGQKIRLSGCGIVQNEKVGDMIITVEINLPKNMTEEEIQLYKKLAEIRKGKLGNSIYDR